MIIDGKKIAEKIFTYIKNEVKQLPFKPIVCDILVGENLVSEQYAKIKEKKAVECGMDFIIQKFSKDVDLDFLIKQLKDIQQIKNLFGIIVQLPLPQNINYKTVFDCIEPSKDPDCLSEKNYINFNNNNNFLISPPAAKAVLEILDSLNLNLEQKKIIVIGKGKLVGSPVSTLLCARGLKITNIDHFTSNPNELIYSADVIISATGKPNLLNRSNVKKMSVIIDAGTAEESGGVVGDADFESLKDFCDITPVPGGVGPVTVAMVLKNVVELCKISNKK